jgi:hypothetical protein
MRAWDYTLSPRFILTHRAQAKILPPVRGKLRAVSILIERAREDLRRGANRAFTEKAPAGVIITA